MSQDNNLQKLEFYEEMRVKAYKDAGLHLIEKEKIECNHICSSECRRTGCKCNCGEYHLEDEERNEPEWVGTQSQWAKASLLWEQYLENND